MFDAARKRLSRICKRLLDTRGVAAVEFAFLLPVMLLIYLGTYELSQAVAVYRLTQLTNTTVLNIVSQYVSISQSTQLPDIFSAASDVLTPYPNNALVIVSGISIDVHGQATVTWSQTNTGTGALVIGQIVTVPAALDVPNTFLIFGQTTYAFKPVVDYMGLGTLNLHSQLYMLPRASQSIALTP